MPDEIIADGRDFGRRKYRVGQAFAQEKYIKRMDVDDAPEADPRNCILPLIFHLSWKASVCVSHYAITKHQRAKDLLEKTVATATRVLQEPAEPLHNPRTATEHASAAFHHVIKLSAQLRRVYVDALVLLYRTAWTSLSALFSGTHRQRYQFFFFFLTMAAASTSKDGHQGVKFHFIEHVMSVPTVNFLRFATTECYSAVKKRSALAAIALDTVEKCASHAYTCLGKPAVEQLSGPLQVADNLACMVLQKLENNYPVIGKMPDEIIEHARDFGKRKYTDGRDYVQEKYMKTIDEDFRPKNDPRNWALLRLLRFTWKASVCVSCYAIAEQQRAKDVIERTVATATRFLEEPAEPLHQPTTGSEHVIAAFRHVVKLAVQLGRVYVDAVVLLYRTAWTRLSARSSEDGREIASSQYHFVDHVISVPSVNLLCFRTAECYSALKKHSALTAIALDTVEKCASHAYSRLGKPAVEQLSGPLQVADNLACKALNKLENNYSVISKTPHEIIADARDIGKRKYGDGQAYAQEKRRFSVPFKNYMMSGLLSSSLPGIKGIEPDLSQENDPRNCTFSRLLVKSWKASVCLSHFVNAERQWFKDLVEKTFAAATRLLEGPAEPLQKPTTAREHASAAFHHMVKLCGELWRVYADAFVHLYSTACSSLAALFSRTEPINLELLYDDAPSSCEITPTSSPRRQNVDLGYSGLDDSEDCCASEDDLYY
ncbi:hypothetical protein HPB49_016177 [Dermacentor silvarum]|uniref:Uncharacterized protein n=1 Tax=Dermacentor silvarum TaxID=543639 RepID=A0ACB8DJV5_DERSI|nr:hypothetical protein HPB49_016177 [Dermacentor silvarum]